LKFEERAQGRKIKEEEKTHGGQINKTKGKKIRRGSGRRLR